MKQDVRELVAAAVSRAEVRARKRYALDAIGILERYSILTGLLEQLSRALPQASNVHVLYYPVKSEEVYCVRRVAGTQQFELLEMKDHFLELKQVLYRLAEPQPDNKVIATYLQPQDTTRNGVLSHDAYRIVSTALADRIKEQGVLQGAPVLLIPFYPPEHLLRTIPRAQDLLTGLLVLTGEGGKLTQDLLRELGERLQEEFRRYVENVRRLASYEPDFLIPSLVSQEARIQESIWKGLGHAIYMLLHRFRNLRQAAQFIGEHFPTVEDVQSHPEMYERRVRDMKTQMEGVSYLESILRHLPERPEIVPHPVEEVKEIFEVAFNKAIAAEGVETQLALTVDRPDLLAQQIIPPSELVEEVFSIHLDNALREIKRPGTTDKRLIVRIYDDGDYICFSLTNFGPPIPPDVLSDLRQIVQVQRPGHVKLKQPQRTGLGVFLSAMILWQVDGSVEFRSPIEDEIGTKVILRFRKYTT